MVDVVFDGVLAKSNEICFVKLNQSFGEKLTRLFVVTDGGGDG